MAKVMIDDIREAMKRAQKKEKEKIEAEAEKNAEIRQLENLRTTIDGLETVPEATKDKFTRFIDTIIKNNGVIPDENPISDYMDELQDQAQSNFDAAEEILSQSKRGV